MSEATKELRDQITAGLHAAIRRGDNAAISSAQGMLSVLDLGASPPQEEPIAVVNIGEQPPESAVVSIDLVRFDLYGRGRYGEHAFHDAIDSSTTGTRLLKPDGALITLQTKPPVASLEAVLSHFAYGQGWILGMGEKAGFWIVLIPSRLPTPKELARMTDRAIANAEAAGIAVEACADEEITFGAGERERLAGRYISAITGDVMPEAPPGAPRNVVEMESLNNVSLSLLEHNARMRAGMNGSQKPDPEPPTRGPRRAA